ncbi:MULTISPECIES: hypothetical protein [Rhizobium/Agrobacterium group]|uniref:hypothetical protein n=1 Tax=Rhizobium/Agrobacterium group TaxID=227290 RepID=UPI0004D9F1C5|nr:MULTISPECIES: hypothetical protein [Rhizobium/Agrobacterium group]KEA03022.1 hypothetical protein CN09_33535 [Rhizobium rhizogenes]NTB05446.1 hypothetical protein [Agrobacterium tumefaciens]NTE53232.1 hypothetical protein [Agrobacterium tumefaciens]NTJ27352.1 hypothetical protein [Rhizobium rhizogenes]QUE84775.1 hypothetical protein EML492_31990 [Rhizobium rhizogenes]
MAFDSTRTEQIDHPAMMPFRNKHSRPRQAVEDQISDLFGTQVRDHALGTEDIRSGDDLHASKAFGRNPLSLAFIYHNRMSQYRPNREGCSFAVIQSFCGAATNQACKDALTLIIEFDKLEQFFAYERCGHFCIISCTKTVGDELIADDGGCPKLYSECAHDIARSSRRIEINDHTRIDHEMS